MCRSTCAMQDPQYVPKALDRTIPDEARAAGTLAMEGGVLGAVLQDQWRRRVPSGNRAVTSTSSASLRMGTEARQRRRRRCLLVSASRRGDPFFPTGTARHRLGCPPRQPSLAAFRPAPSRAAVRRRTSRSFRCSGGLGRAVAARRRGGAPASSRRQEFASRAERPRRNAPARPRASTRPSLASTTSSSALSDGTAPSKSNTKPTSPWVAGYLQVRTVAGWPRAGVHLAASSRRTVRTGSALRDPMPSRAARRSR